MITTKTADRLMRMAVEAQAISDALYEAGHREAADTLTVTARYIALCGEDVRSALERFAHAALTTPTEGEGGAS